MFAAGIDQHEGGTCSPSGLRREPCNPHRSASPTEHPTTPRVIFKSVHTGSSQKIPVGFAWTSVELVTAVPVHGELRTVHSSSL